MNRQKKFMLKVVLLVTPLLLVISSSFCLLSAAETFILKPTGTTVAYDIAAKELQKYWCQSTGETLKIVTDDPGHGDLIVLGADSVNHFARTAIEKKWISGFVIRSTSDDYRILSAKDGKEGKRNILFLAGARPRSTLYAVYHFLEERAQCRWFWDGDVVPKMKSIDITGLDITESPRFEYRGLRYFAHRGLTRFQAEHWGPADWEKEIDWMLKKRLNVFMLRIGHDDIFQKAFPDIVPYPDPEQPLPERIERSYDDRSLFWSLQYRGKLRKHILSYAFDRDLMHPEDFGTMSHWYSRTPVAWLEKIKPEFVPQATSGYGEPTGLVWDIRQDKYLDYYFKLTDTHIKEYGRPQLFHTIGIAERMCYKDRADNLEMKLYSYRRLLMKLREKYPNAPVLLAGWDFYNSWHNDEVVSLLRELDPKQTLIWDYTSDGASERNFTNWGVVGKFPYVFGVFEAFEASTDIRGDYPLIEERIAVAEPDPFCKGYIYWPECSHADIYMLNYFPAEAWNPKDSTGKELLAKFCTDRYGKNADAMKSIWTEFLPLSATGNWQYYGDRFFFHTFTIGQFWVKTAAPWLERRDRYAVPIKVAPDVFRHLAALPLEEKNAFLTRDIIDIARTTADRVMIYAAIRLNLEIRQWIVDKKNPEELQKLLKEIVPMLNSFRDLLGQHEDYSLLASLKRLGTIEKVSSRFEKTLLANAANGYCRSYVYEFFDNFYTPTIEEMVKSVSVRIDKNDVSPWGLPKGYREKQAAIYDQLYSRNLADMAPKTPKTPEKLRSVLLDLARKAEIITAK